MRVQVFVEGGGNQDRTKTACRKAFHSFLEKLLGDLPKPRIVACGSRNDAYGDFCRSISNDPDVAAILLVDSESALAKGTTVEQHLQDGDHWTELPNGRVHLMVQCMESWFLADKATLATYYNEGFKESALSENPKIEEIPKRDVLRGLEQATVVTRKGVYHKTRHGFEILARLDANAVQQRSPRAAALFAALSQLLGSDCR